MHHLPEITWTIKDERSWSCECGQTGSLFSGPNRLEDAKWQAILHVFMAEAAEGQDVVVQRAEWDTLLAVATIYVDAFEPDETMTLPEKLRLQLVEEILEKYGKRY